MSVQSDSDLPAVRPSVVATANRGDVTTLDFSSMSKSKKYFHLNDLLMKASVLLDSIPV